MRYALALLCAFVGVTINFLFSVHYCNKMFPHWERWESKLESSPKHVYCEIALIFGPIIAISFGAIGGYQATLEFNFWIGLIPSCTVWLVLLPLIFIFVRTWQISYPLFDTIARAFAALRKVLINDPR